MFLLSGESLESSTPPPFYLPFFVSLPIFYGLCLAALQYFYLFISEQRVEHVDPYPHAAAQNSSITSCAPAPLQSFSTAKRRRLKAAPTNEAELHLQSLQLRERKVVEAAVSELWALFLEVGAHGSQWSDYVALTPSDKEQFAAMFFDDMCLVALPTLQAALRLLRRCTLQTAIGFSPKLMSLGITDESLDEALDSETRKSKCEIFQNFYQWTLKSKEMVCDTLLARIVREFDVGQPSMFSVLRARSLATFQRSQPVKKHRVTESLHINVAQVDDDVVALEDSGKLRTYFSCLRILGLGWAVAGCFDVSFGGKQVKFCHWQHVCTYISNLEEKAWSALSKTPEDAVLTYILETEEKIRATAIERCRADSMPWGQALLHAWKEEVELWTDARDKLLANKASPKHEVAKSVPSSSAIKVKPATANHLPSGVEICKRWNDARTCKGRCPKGKAHVCDVLLQSGAVCGSSHHCRNEHDPGAHGEVTFF
eukprot:s48_g35.t1